MNNDDYRVFLHILKTALSAPSYKPEQGQTLSDKSSFRQRRKNFFQKIDLLSYCLMPNHFHFLLRQNSSRVISEFIRSLCASYVMYFNKKYDRVGALFQGVFKAIDVDNEDYLLWVSRYIHRNPSEFRTYPYSSYGEYLGLRHTPWINTQLLLDYFSNSRLKQTSNYQKFVDDDLDEPSDLPFLLLEDNN